MNARDTFRLTGIAAALAAALGPAHAAEVLAPSGLNTTASAASAGLGYTPDDGRRFGEYNGINEKGAYGLLDFNLVKRDEETGTWLGLWGRNVGLENRQLRFDHSRQGNWGYYLEYSRIPRFDPLTPVTGVGGIGTSNLTIPLPTAPVAGSPIELKTIRDVYGLGFEKFLFGKWDVQVRFRNEEKDGTRLFGRGDTGNTNPAAFCDCDFGPEPIKSTTRQLDAKINYTGSQLQLSGGYYGTMYNNDFSRLDFTGGSSTITPVGLPPDNQSHQLYLGGGYSFTPTTRGNFKVAYAKATQEDAFIAVPVAPGIGSNLDARVDTTLAQAGIISRPLPKLTLLADLRYEDRDDKTPVRVFFTPGTNATTDGTNEPRSITTTTGKAEASYALPNAFRLTGGLGYEEKKRNTFPIRAVSFRETTDELSYRVELRRMMTETVTGALAYVHSDRDGSPWLTTTVFNPTASPLGSNLIAPIHLADRKRDKVKLTVNWAPIEALTLNFNVDVAQDDYSTRDGSTIGPMEGSAQNYAIDVGYAITQQWQVTAWYSLNNTKAEQTTCAGASGNPAVCGSPTYAATLKNLSNNFGAGVRGKPSGSKLEFGADLSYSDIKDEYQQQALIGAPIASLPDITTKLTRLNLFGKYALQKNSGVRLDYIYDRYKTNDWTWSTWMFADGTRITQDPNQTVNFLAATYYYRF